MPVLRRPAGPARPDLDVGAPAQRGQGVAGLLVRAVAGWAVADGARELALWVADGNDVAARVYARAGFVGSGRRQPLPSNPAIGEEEWVLPLGP